MLFIMSEPEDDSVPNKFESTRQWIEDQSSITSTTSLSDTEDRESEVSSVMDSCCDTYTDYDGYEDDEEEETSVTYAVGQQTMDIPDVTVLAEQIKQIFNGPNSVQTLGNVKIDNSSGIHIGNVTNINGDINITYAAANPHKHGHRKCSPSSSRSGRKSSPREQEQAPASVKETSMKSQAPTVEEREEQISKDAFISNHKFKFPKGICKIKPRHSWLAQSPMEEVEILPEPVQFVVISHTATESSEKQAINVRLIRDIQCFHIESRGWNDIAYNFLVGCDGFIYEGRGWGVVGAHTLGYNSRSIGISFIGCFMRSLPTKVAMEACKNLLRLGVEEGHISKDYKLICHCQCSSTESPGKKLFEEIQTWTNFYNIEEEEEDDDGKAGIVE